MTQSLPTFVDPTFGDAGPSPEELAGRLVAIIPLSVDHEAPGYDAGTIVSAVTFDLYVLDGGPLVYGAAPKKNRPAQYRIQTPAFFKGQINSGVNIVRALIPHIGKGSAVLGRIVRSDVGRKPWNLDALPAGDPGRNLAAQIFGALAAGTYTLPTPEDLPQVAATVQAIQPAQVAQFAQAAPVVTPWGPPSPAPAPWPPAAPVAAPAAPAPAPIGPPPPGIDPGAWAQMTDEQRGVLAGQYAAYQAQQAAAAAPVQAGPPANPWG